MAKTNLNSTAIMVILLVMWVMFGNKVIDSYVDYVDSKQVYNHGSESYIKYDTDLSRAFMPSMEEAGPVYKPYPKETCRIGYGSTIAVLQTKGDNLTIMVQDAFSRPLYGSGSTCVSGTVGVTNRKNLSHIR